MFAKHPDPPTVVEPAKSGQLVAALAATTVVPAIVADAGDAATKRFLEFFAVTIRNMNTRTAYLHAASRFFAWCEHHQLGASITSLVLWTRSSRCMSPLTSRLWEKISRNRR